MPMPPEPSQPAEVSHRAQPVADHMKAGVAVIGAGPGGVITAAMLAEAGCDVVLLEEGPHLALDSAPHFSCEEIIQKYRNGGVTVGLGRVKTAYVEGCCVGGGSEVNRGLYARARPEVLAGWRRDFAVADLEDATMEAHHEACEQIARVSLLPGSAPLLSRKLKEGGEHLGWRVDEVPRLASYQEDRSTGRIICRKQSMSETFVPRFLAAGGRLLAGMRVLRLSRGNGRWRVRAVHAPTGAAARSVDLYAETVIVAGGAVHTPALLRRSGFTRHIGDNFCFHPMVKLVAAFSEEVNPPGQLDPVHQIKHFDPRFSMGCSMSSRPLLSLSMVDHPEHLGEVDRHWRHMGIYYAQTTGGRGVVRCLPLFKDPLVKVRYAESELRDLADGFVKLGECLFAAGAVALYPGITGAPVLRSPEDLHRMPAAFLAGRANLTALHLFSSCPMGENEARCATDSFGKVRGADQLYISDASLLPGPTVVNPQGSVMAVAHRNALHYLERRGARARRG